VLVILSIGLAMSEWHAELGRLSSEYWEHIPIPLKSFFF
jgi:hypothetical protein